jgi:pyruvyl transferase EpsO
MDDNPKTNSEVMVALAEKHKILCSLIEGKPFHYMGAPVHSNIGDLLIMQGTFAFFNKYGLLPRRIGTERSCRSAMLSPGDVVIFQGGGNFGDLYPEGQKVREHMLSAWPKNRMIFLPQSIFFISREAKALSVARFRRHRDVHICVRDAASFEEAKEFSDYVYLLPDMAHNLYPLKSQFVPSLNTLVLQRTDGEKYERKDINGASVSTRTDWPNIIGKREIAIRGVDRLMKYCARVGLERISDRIVLELWIRYAKSLTADAVTLFARHNRVMTDRLHGHILACLMDKPNIVFDNSYGKNSSYVKAWTGLSPLVSQGDWGRSEARASLEARHKAAPTV